MGGWVSVAGLVAGYDLWARRRAAPTMSAAYRDAYQAHPWLMLTATGYVTGHLTGWLPRRLDVLRLLR